MRIWLHVSLILGLIWTLPTPILLAQEAAAPAADSPTAAVDSAAEVKPEIFYLRDKRGEPIYVPNFSLEEWERLVQIARNLSNPQRPAYVIEEMIVDGVARGDQVEFTIRVSIHRRKTEGMAADAWVRVPLRLNRATQTVPPEYDGDGDFFLTYEDNQDGYTCWMQADEDTTHDITLHVLAPIEKAGDQSTIQLTTPTPLASTLRLRVSETMAEGSVISDLDEVSRSLPFESISSTEGEFSARGIRGLVTISWQPAAPQYEPRAAQLDVKGAITVTVDERVQEVRSEGEFEVRSFGSPIDRFRLRLPPGFRLREAPDPHYSINLLEDSTAAAAEGQLVEVTLNQASTFEPQIRVLAELPAERSGTESFLTLSELIDQPATFEPARFTVLGAVRHRGHIDFTVKGDWKLQWDDNPNIVRDDLEPTTFSEGETNARFRYTRQPCDLQVAIRQKSTRIHVEPTYELLVDSQQVRVFATFSCTTSGAKAHPLAFQLSGWTVEALRFKDIPTPLPIDLSAVDPLVVPTPAEAQTAGTFELQLEARKSLTAGVISGTQPLRITLPRVEALNPARADVLIAPAAVTVTPAVNVTLTPREQEMQALVPLIKPANGGPNGVAVRMFRYRDRGSAEPASFVSDFKIQSRSIAIGVDSSAVLSRGSLDVEQLLSCDVQHEEVESLVLSVPRTMVDGNQVGLRVLLNEQPLVPRVEASAGTDRVPVVITLPGPILGSFQLRLLHQRSSVPEFSAEAPQVVPLPLVFPSTDRVLGSSVTIINNTLQITHDEALLVKATGGAWSVQQVPKSRGRIALTTASNGDNVSLQVSLSPNRSGSTTVHQAWIQTWLAGTRRRDRAVFRVRTGEPQLRVLLPQSAMIDESLVALAVNRREVQDKQIGINGEITVALGVPEDDSQREFLVEVWYSMEGLRPTQGSLQLEAASLDAVDRTERCYWQLVFPSDELLVRGDPQFTPELSWRWHHFGWQRQPLREQQDLEDWIGASRQQPVPTATNRYVFTSFGVPTELRVVTLARSLILLIGSGITLLLGLLLLYAPALRHPAVLLTAGVALLGMGLVRPELSVVIAQAAVLGIVLIVVAKLLRLAVTRGGVAEPSVLGRSQYSDSNMTELRYPHMEGSSRITTGSAPVAIQMPTAESKS